MEFFYKSLDLLSFLPQNEISIETKDLSSTNKLSG